jgi:DNA polymerase III subunit beta
MHIKCQKDELLNGVNTVLKAVSTRTTLPILQCILLDAHDHGFKLIGNDLELGIESDLKANIIKNGNVAIDARMFSEIVKKLPDSEVEIIVDDHYLMMIRCDKSEFLIPGQAGNEFIQLPQITKNRPLIIGQNLLKTMIHQTIFSIAIEEIRPILTGELFEIKSNKLNIVSVDGYRVSIRQTDLKDSFSDISVVIPGKTLSEIQKILNSDEESEVAVFFTDRHILFEMNSSIIVSRLLEGDFPKYDQIFSSDYETLIKVDRKNMLQSIERSALIARESKKSPIKFQIRDSILTISSNTDLGKVHEEIDIHREGKELDIAFNPRYLIDALKVIEDDEIQLSFTTSLNPCIIRDSNNDTYKYLVLPIRLN